MKHITYRPAVLDSENCGPSVGTERVYSKTEYGGYIIFTTVFARDLYFYE